MVFPALTATYAALFGIFFTALSIWVVAGRAAMGVHHGDGGKDALHRRIRAHGNFAEYVPLILLLAGLLEVAGAGRWTLHALLLPLLVARIMHPIGMIAPLDSMQQFAFRAPAVVVTWIVMLAASILLLMRVV